MIVSLSLLAVGLVFLLLGPRLAGAPWMSQAPRLAILTWQAVTLCVVLAVVLAGVTLLIPVTALAGDLGDIVHACAVSVASAYGAAEILPGKLIGALLAGVLPAWIGLCALRVLIGGWRRRRALHRSLDLVTKSDPRHGMVVLEAAAPAAFCVPGWAGQIVVTTGALERLSTTELDGVLAHEAAHLRGRHNVAVALSEILARAFPRVRLFAVAAVHTRQLIELLADDAAVRHVDRISVASAIVSLAEMRAPSAALAMAQDAAALRVKRLLSPAAPMPPWRYRLGAFTALAITMMPVFLAAYPALCAALSDLCNIP